MGEAEDTTSGTTVAHTETSAESEKGQTRKSSVRGGHGYRGNTRNNTRDSSKITSKYYKGGV